MSEIEVVCPNVGQANCSYIHKDGNAVIFDMGSKNSYNTVMGSLRKDGVKNIRIVISHLDDDHCGGLIKYLESFSGEFTIDELIIPERGDETDTDNFNKIRKLVYQNEIILSTREHFKMPSEEFEEFQKSIHKSRKNKTSALYKEFEPQNEKERLTLKFLVYKANNEVFDTTDFNSLKELCNSDEEEVYKYIKDYTEAICNKKGYKFIDLHMDTLKTGQEKTIKSYDFGEVRMIKPDVEEFEKENNNSIVSFLDIKGEGYCSTFCFPGDIEAKQEKEILKMMDKYDMKSAILIAPHHASNTSSTKEFIEAINPTLIVIQAQEGVYGHPHPGVLGNYEKWNINYLIQESEGAITFQVQKHDYIYVMTDKLKEKLLETALIASEKVEKLEKTMILYLAEKEDHQKLSDFVRANDEEKIKFFEEVGSENNYRKVSYAKEASKTILENKGVDINDFSFFNLAYQKGKLNIQDGVEFFSKNNFLDNIEQENFKTR